MHEGSRRSYDVVAVHLDPEVSFAPGTKTLSGGEKLDKATTGKWSLTWK